MMLYGAYALAALVCLLIFYWRHRKGGYRGPFRIHGADVKDVKVYAAVFVLLDAGSVLYYLATYPGGFPKISLPLPMIVLAVYAGINEEICDRAIPAAIMMRNKPTTRRVLVTVLLTSVLFGVSHIVNMLAGQDLASTIIQIIFTMGAGLFFAGIYLRTGSISLTIVIHMLHNLLSFIVETLPAVETVELTVNDVLSLLVNVVPFVFGILMLLPKRYPEIVETWKYVWDEKESVN